MAHCDVYAIHAQPFLLDEDGAPLAAVPVVQLGDGDVAQHRRLVNHLDEVVPQAAVLCQKPRTPARAPEALHGADVEVSEDPVHDLGRQGRDG